MQRKASSVRIPFPKHGDERGGTYPLQKYSANPVVLETYGPNDLAEIPAFQGGYINFGYWKNIRLKEGEITQAERIKASEALYDLVLDRLNIERNDRVLEVGCGRGNGCAKITDTLKPLLTAGIDITPEQIERARRIHQAWETSSLLFQVGSSEFIPFSDESFTKIYSIEAAQCFPSILNFALEAWRTLEKGGDLITVAPFATSESGYQALRKVIPTINQGVDLLIPIENVRQSFQRVGFKEVEFQVIGEDVFEGFHQWRTQVKDIKWVDNYFYAYNEGNIDYFLFHVRK